jgi:hypothetical protein
VENGPGYLLLAMEPDGLLRMSTMIAVGHILTQATATA